MKKVVFVMPEDCLPVPAVMGGAVETLMTMLIEQNEINPQFEFHFVMSKTKQEKEVKNIYKYTVLHQFSTSSLERKISKYFNSINWRLNYKFPLYVPYNIKVGKIIKEINPDFVIYENGFDASIKLIHKKTSAVKLLHIHNKFIMKKAVNTYIKNIISVSNFMKDDWLNDCSDANVKVLANAINDKYFNVDSVDEDQKQILRSKLGINPTDFVVLYTGRIIPVKGVLELVKAVDELQDKTIKLVLVGATFFDRKMKQTPYQKQIQQITESNKNIVATGYVPYEKLVYYYSIANVQVIPSLWEEPAGLVAVEGNFCGLPQIITNSGGLPENCSSSAIVIDKNGDVVLQLKKAILKVKNENLKNNKDATPLTSKNYFNEFIRVLNQFCDN